ncbi:hypothetical protein C8R31_101685 [Nitrosospira sp. Nsp2]|uniref:hypothetical protein n=1 Tax=Nitrosospira sp. Nsp2 TaxID=136548 RepID=UPI000D30D339|nr:hypothetical protein [Nitrosospira sp. Nsp2]PTR17521.1 hypothetical protein C8R31_101685 [Nitrosospira sp. Nsp2]
MARNNRWARAGLNSFVDFAIEHWVAIVSVLASGSAGYIASLSEPIAKYGLVAWVAIGLLVGLGVAAVAWLLSGVRVKLSQANWADRQAQMIAINPLAKRFERERLKLSDFFHPFYMGTEKARFEECELLGPAHIILIGCDLRSCIFNDCEIVIIKNNIPIRGCTVFLNCFFENSTFFSVTFYMPKEYFEVFKSNNGQHPPVISDGMAGNL